MATEVKCKCGHWQATGYSILSGRLTIYDKNRKVLLTMTADGTGKEYDFDFSPAPPVRGTRAVRFTSLKDQGAANGSRDVALAEIRIE